jgi:proteasome lid subunit RPN8/RPN11
VPDSSAPPYRLPASVGAELYQHARECYPEECCGLVFGPPRAAGHRIVRCTNVQGTRAARGGRAVRTADRQKALAQPDDVGMPALPARHAFWMEEGQLLRALREADVLGEELRAIYHSHVDAEAYLSWIDADCAVGPSGTPHYPGAAQLVISVRDGAVRHAVAYVWDAPRARFVGRLVELAPTGAAG